MKLCTPVMKSFVRFFGKSQLFTDGYAPVEGDKIPHLETPVVEVKSCELFEWDFLIPGGAVGCVCFDVITTQVKDGERIQELTSGEINVSGRYFFQIGDYGRSAGSDYGRVVIHDEAPEDYARHTSMRRYCHAHLPEKIILYTGEQYYRHGYSFPRTGRHHTRETCYYVCAFDFLKTDILVPLHWIFPQGFFIGAAAEKKGIIKHVA